ncbi:MAG: protein BatD, partial [Gammaproteobacteria bacterium]|nr:protein BatD [Gammaproteobacteria bacterium]
QTDTSTLKLSEEIEGVRWQILRYDLSLFAQREGAVDIPAFGVSFVASTGYGQPETAFDLMTEPIKIKLQRPPGADPSQPVVTSSALSIDEQWKPVQDEFMAGDALTRIITIQAEDVSAIALPAMATLQLDGIEVLTEPAVVRDETNRGTLTGYRQEQVSYLFQKEGNYKLPAWSISWWNPKNETLERHEFAARTFTVAPNPAMQTQQDETGELLQANNEQWWLWPLLLVGLIVIAAGTASKIRPIWRKRYAEYRVSEPYRYRQALAACRENDPAQAFRKVSRWLASTSVQRGSEFEKYWAEMQLALVSRDVKWSGSQLANALSHIRKETLVEAKRVKLHMLNPMNPG